MRKHERPSSSKLPCIDDLLSNDLLEPYKVIKPRDELAYLCFSSGTTSAAKDALALFPPAGDEILIDSARVMTSHSNMCAVLSLLDPFNGTPDDVMLACLPFSHIYGLTKLVHWPILSGMTIVIMPKFELQPFCSYVPRYKATITLLVPPVILLLVCSFTSPMPVLTYKRHRAGRRWSTITISLA